MAGIRVRSADESGKWTPGPAQTVERKRTHLLLWSPAARVAMAAFYK
ncbi:MAG TPA: hypothetical protein VJW77_07160 [Terriglobia bacterium]|nr:hypothetical protein [Terriglobia bacterium]